MRRSTSVPFSDVLSGFSVFLIALPLSIGIAIASGAPPSAGLLAAAVGGLLGAHLGSSALAINGPAAGLIVLVLGAVSELGQGDPVRGFPLALAAFVVAGLIQVGFGLFKLGKYGASVPSSVLHGMMAAIGVSIVAKQIHSVFGVIPVAKSIFGLILEVPSSFVAFNPEVFVVGLISAVILLVMLQAPEKVSRVLPAPLLVAVAGIGLSSFLDFEHEHMVAAHMSTMTTGPRLLLDVPVRFMSLFKLPDFSAWNQSLFWRWSITIAVVASLESMLSAVALDRIDSQRRKTDLDRELWSKGLCNAFLGFVGGLPIIAEIVRSTANMKNGASGKWSNFFHGMFILGFVILFPGLLHRIPIASLGVILVFVGVRLAHPRQVFHLAEIGKSHALAFLVTLLVTLGTDLLIGVFAGILVELVFAMIHGKSFTSIFRSQVETEDTDGGLVLRIRGVAAFSNWASLANVLSGVDAGRKIILDFTGARLIDHTVIEQLDRMRHDGYGEDRMEILFDRDHKPLASHPQSGKVKRSLA